MLFFSFPQLCQGLHWCPRRLALRCTDQEKKQAWPRRCQTACPCHICTHVSAKTITRTHTKTHTHTHPHKHTTATTTPQHPDTHTHPHTHGGRERTTWTPCITKQQGMA